MSALLPWRSTRGGLEHSDLEIDTAAEGYAYDAPMNGTQPYRNTRGGLDHSDLQVDVHVSGQALALVYRPADFRCVGSFPKA